VVHKEDRNILWPLSEGIWVKDSVKSLKKNCALLAFKKNNRIDSSGK